MKTKIINNKTPMNNTKTESRIEMNKKIQILTEKLANHFKLRLSSLIIEKNYKYSNMILDIGTFVRKLENSTYETETVIPKLEKYLLEILTKLPSQNSQHISMDKINQMLKVGHIDNEIKINSNYAINENVINNPVSPKNLNIKNNIGKDLKNVVSGSDNIKNKIESNKNLISDYNLETLTKDSPNKKSDIKLQNNTIIASKTEINKNRNISKTNSKDTIINLNNNKANNINHRNLKKNQSINKNNDKINNLVTDPIKDKIANLNTNISNNTYLTSNNFINTTDDENYISNNLGKSNSTNMNTLNSNNHYYNYSNKNKNNLNIIQKTEKLNDLKEKALDEWAMIVKYNHLKHLEEEQNKRNKEEEKKKKVREILDNQMKEKDQMKKMKQEEDKKFFQMQTVTIEHMEKDYVEKERLRLEKIKFQKESQEKLIKGKIDYILFSFQNIKTSL